MQEKNTALKDTDTAEYANFSLKIRMSLRTSVRTGSQ